MFKLRENIVWFEFWKGSSQLLCGEGSDLGKTDAEVRWEDIITPGLQMTLAWDGGVVVAVGKSGYILIIIRT